MMDKFDFNASANIMRAAHDDAKAKGLKKGNGGLGTCPCPCGGTIEYSVASYNGHMWLRCDSCNTRIMQ